jgi:hypothetical protein
MGDVGLLDGLKHFQQFFCWCGFRAKGAKPRDNSALALDVAHTGKDVPINGSQCSLVLCHIAKLTWVNADGYLI